MDELQAKTMPALDWHGIWPGYVSHDEEGLYFPQDLPTGIRLAVQQAECSEPVMARQKRWEAGNIHYPSLIKEGDRYRLWYCCFADPEDPWVQAGHVPGKVPGLWCYAESGDGFHWERPELGRVEYAGSKDNNILFVCDQVGSSYGYMNVMRDPNGSAEERYKAIGITGKFEVDGRPASRAEVMELRAKREAAGDAGEIGANITSQVVVTAGVSADGYSWTHLPEPIMAPPFLLDTQNILTYDADSGKYVIYLRSGRERRRAVSRYEADTFRGPWDNHLMVLTAEPDDPPDWDIYAPGYCRHPHGPHLMFFSPYRRASDLVDVYLATSYDGQLWYRPERKPIIPVSERYGSLYPTPELVELDQDRWGVLTLACPHPHNRSSDHPHEYIWATWKRDRLVAWEADDWAEFALSEQLCAGQQLKINFKTLLPGAFVEVEIVDGSLPNRTGAELVPALAGFSFADCDRMAGDELAAVVSWRGKSDLSALKGRKIHLRFRMARAQLFAVTL